MPVLLLALSLGAASDPVLILDIRARDTEAALAETITNTVTVLVAKKNPSVYKEDDLTELSALEAERQALGCDDVSCLAELAGALGARRVLAGEVGRLGDLVVVSLTLYDTEAAEALTRANAQVERVEDLPRALEAAVDELFSSGSSWKTPSLIASGSVAALGMVTAVVGVIPLLGYNAEKAALNAAATEYSSAPNDALLRQMAQRRAALEDNRDAYNAWGAPLVVLGVSAAIVGGGACVALSVLEFE